MAPATGLTDLRFLIPRLEAGRGVRPQVHASARANHREQENGQTEDREREDGFSHQASIKRTAPNLAPERRDVIKYIHARSPEVVHFIDSA